MRVSAKQSLVDLGELLRVHPAVKHNELIITPMEEDVMVQVNGTDLIQMLRNLMVNALQCTNEKHRVQLNHTMLPEPINLAAMNNGPEERFIQTEEFQNTAGLLALSVEDTGPGIPPENMKKIFSQSFTTQEAGKGTGLGLSIVHRLVSRAQGAIHVRTKIGQGTVFTIYLPVW